jgi:hypothetical protein
MADYRNRTDIYEIVDFLNSLLKIDRKAISKVFIDGRTECNEELADHPFVQVGSYVEGEYIVGALGLLNGLFVGEESIGMTYDNETRMILNFSVQQKSDFK